MSFMNIAIPSQFPPLTKHRLFLIGAFAFCGLLGLSIGIGYLAADRASADIEQSHLRSSGVADFQRMNASDRAITQRIRRSIHQDKTLSAYAPNIKITSEDGKVILTGKIRNEDEKDYLAAKAVAVAGEGNVSNRLEVTRSE
jgi:hypothetical protein